MAQSNQPIPQGKRRPSPESSGSQTTELPELLTAEDVAIWLKISVKAVYAKAERGKLPGVAHVGDGCTSFAPSC